MNLELPIEQVKDYLCHRETQETIRKVRRVSRDILGADVLCASQGAEFDAQCKQKQITESEETKRKVFC